MAARVESTAPGSQLNRIARVAAQTAPSRMWTTRAHLEERALPEYSARPPQKYREPAGAPAQMGRRRRIRTYMVEAIDPRLTEVELP